MRSETKFALGGKKLSIALTTIFIFTMFGCYGYVAKSKRLYPKPENLSQEVANYIITHPDKKYVNEENGTKIYKKMYVDVDEVVWMQVIVHADGSATLSLSSYQLDTKVSNFTPESVVKQKLAEGKIKILIEVRFVDEGVDGNFDYYEMFLRKDSLAFTEKERDDDSPGVIKYAVYPDGAIWQNGVRVDGASVEVSVKILKDVQKSYGSLLECVAVYYNIAPKVGWEDMGSSLFMVDEDTSCVEEEFLSEVNSKGCSAECEHEGCMIKSCPEGKSAFCYCSVIHKAKCKCK